MHARTHTHTHAHTHVHTQMDDRFNEFFCQVLLHLYYKFNYMGVIIIQDDEGFEMIVGDNPTRDTNKDMSISRVTLKVNVKTTCIPI